MVIFYAVSINYRIGKRYLFFSLTDGASILSPSCATPLKSVKILNAFPNSFYNFNSLASISLCRKTNAAYSSIWKFIRRNSRVLR